MMGSALKFHGYCLNSISRKNKQLKQLIVKTEILSGRMALTLLSLLLTLSTVLRAQIYVSPSGSDTSQGTIESPVQTLTKALSMAGPDSMIYLRGGTYACSTKVIISKVNPEGHDIKVWAYPGETPVFDFALETSSDGISLTGSYCHLKGLEIKNAFHNGINVSGHFNVIENCRSHDNRNSGIQMGSSSSLAYPSDNLFLNCDSYLNYDAPIGGNADGFAIKWKIGTGNVFRGCRAYNNSDDGWDLWMADSTVEIDSCWGFRNGVDSWHSGSFNGNGNGFKLGGSYVATPHVVKNCVSFDNAGNTGRGFDENNNTAGQTLYNCTAYRNKGDNYHFLNTVVQGEHIIKNCISFQGTVNIASGTQEANSWQGFSVDSSDFLSLDTALAVASRNADGSLPTNDLFRLARGSSLIDAGVDVGLQYNGLAPDLGAFESDYPTAVRGSENSGLPTTVNLSQNFPNPFNPTTIIRYQLPFESKVILRVSNILGQTVAILRNGTETAGSKTVEWNASGLPSGVYFYRMDATSVNDRGRTFHSVRKMLLLK
jgi:hypothetical protein